MYKKFLAAAISLLTLSAMATEKIITVDPASGNRRTTSIVITNNVQIVTTNSVAPEAVVNVISSAGAADAGKVVRTGPLGTILPATMASSGAPSSNQFLIAVNSTNATWQTVAAASAMPRVQLYEQGTYNWTNSFGVSSIFVECWGGGGRGADGASQGGTVVRGGGGGGGAAYCAGTVTVTNNQIIAIVVGAPVGVTTFGALTANNGSSASAENGGAGGTATGGDINISGTAGQNALGVFNSNSGGNGGFSALGGMFGAGGQGGAAFYNAGAQVSSGQTGGEGAVRVWR